MEPEFNRYLSQSLPYASKVYNTNQNHPLMPSSQQYLFYKKYVSIHSEDRDILKYPNASNFEIEMPEDLLNVLSISLANWTFPSNYNTFSSENLNTKMTFKINNPFNPASKQIPSSYYSAIFKALFLAKENEYTITIETGFYNPTQMVTELTNKFNYEVTLTIKRFLLDTNGPYYNPATFPGILTDFEAHGGYTSFKVVYNSVSQKIWFGNTTDGFELTNETQKQINRDNLYCGAKSILPDFSNWGLPGNLGLSRCNTHAISGSTLEEKTNFVSVNDVVTPRFYYGDVYPGDEGYWLLPNPELPGSEVFWVEGTYKINLMGPSYFYIELEGQNCIDETSPYNVSSFTLKTNQTNGVVNSAFAKIAIPTTPISQWFDSLSLPYKEYMPPAERIRKLKFKIRYHNGQLVDFGVSEYSLLLEFVILQPTQARSYTNAFKGSLVGSKQ